MGGLGIRESRAPGNDAFGLSGNHQVDQGSTSLSLPINQPTSGPGPVHRLSAIT